MDLMIFALQLAGIVTVSTWLALLVLGNFSIFLVEAFRGRTVSVRVKPFVFAGILVFLLFFQLEWYGWI